uniref:Uncharacterized protein n=1 Tax=Pseudoalteromonas luteoviolacea TaxID=43657 RepID=A0A023PZ26_9GAMM|nr:hypothetical protein [Pseudoalteromonas luteoviolacea]
MTHPASINSNLFIEKAPFIIVKTPKYRLLDVFLRVHQVTMF